MEQIEGMDNKIGALRGPKARRDHQPDRAIGVVGYGIKEFPLVGVALRPTGMRVRGAGKRAQQRQAVGGTQPGLVRHKAILPCLLTNATISANLLALC